MATNTKTKQVRVACYCRVSVAEREQSQFGSLEAQRGAIEAYILSQPEAGLTALPERYDDEGFSGSTIERPAFKRVMEDARAGRIDVLAVYKFDRLSRRQIDFLKTVEELDALGIQFVSITQNLDTSTSMGRCMLNVMSAFAQLEREVIAERTSDKMQAARRRGMWTGGRPVLGYDVVDKMLVVNEAEGVTVRRIFQTYLDLGGCVAVAEELGILGIRNKAWTNQAGAQVGGAPFSSTTIHGLLTNPLYRGLVRAQDEEVDGQHEAIVDEDLWDAVQLKLKAQAPGGKSRTKRKTSALLAGIAKCACGAALTPTHSKRGAKTYHYYICSHAQKHGQALCPGTRISAGKLEEHVVEQIRLLGSNPQVVEAALLQEEQHRTGERVQLRADLKELNRARGDQLRKQKKIVDAMGNQGTSPALARGLDESEQSMATIDERIAAAERDLQALDATVTSTEELINALAEFTEIWDTLTLDEQARLLDLLLDAVVYNGRSGAIEIRLRDMAPNGAEAAA